MLAETVGQYTGTKDINGVEIYEGDVVSYDFDDSVDAFIVMYESNGFRKKYEEWDETLRKPLLEIEGRERDMRLMVTGNIHD